ncbi:Hypothetical predicted protein [Olea europaea subsp. europaea]|uniref:Uncharacterized protein n=1 Tax=Olea europaea subsp. europaea TaxID=158383 RepID=A0A8S0SDE3_OLEEU|nr:Hypothetical predicted protein [Olea europaea subsp. europaea]
MSILQSGEIDGVVVPNICCAMKHDKIIIDTDPGTGIFLHDPVSFVLLVRSDLFTFKKGVVLVETRGICVGHTLMDQGLTKHLGVKQPIVWLFARFSSMES